jgi:arginyl-tRNA synthetase
MQYGGEYLQPVGAALAEKYRDAFAEKPESEWLDMFREFAVDAMLELIREDLAALGVRHDVFSSERAMVEAGGVERALQELRRRADLSRHSGTAEGQNPGRLGAARAELFRSTRFGDDVDRPVQKSDGSNTYFANDIAYHADKISRGFTAMIDVWGADHGGYVKRMQAAVRALAQGDAARLDIVLCQIVRVMKDGPAGADEQAGRHLRGIAGFDR